MSEGRLGQDGVPGSVTVLVLMVGDAQSMDVLEIDRAPVEAQRSITLSLRQAEAAFNEVSGQDDDPLA